MCSFQRPIRPRLKTPYIFKPQMGQFWLMSCCGDFPGTRIRSSLFTLEDSPAVCSVGRKCLEQGFEFYWPAEKALCFVRPDGEQVNCRLRGQVPVFGKDMFASAGPAAGNSKGADQQHHAPCQKSGGWSAPTWVEPRFKQFGSCPAGEGVENNNNNPRTQVQNPGLTQEGTRVRTQVQPRFPVRPRV